MLSPTAQRLIDFYRMYEAFTSNKGPLYEWLFSLRTTLPPSESMQGLNYEHATIDNVVYKAAKSPLSSNILVWWDCFLCNTDFWYASVHPDTLGGHRPPEHFRTHHRLIVENLDVMDLKLLSTPKAARVRCSPERLVLGDEILENAERQLVLLYGPKMRAYDSLAGWAPHRCGICHKNITTYAMQFKCPNNPNHPYNIWTYPQGMQRRALPGENVLIHPECICLTPTGIPRNLLKELP